jgi:integrase
MSPLARRLESYLATRRKLGYKLERPAVLLTDFVGFLDRAGASTITTEMALAWATEPAAADPSWWRLRLSAVRVFARWMSTLDSATEVPPTDLLPAGGRRRATPYLYSPDEIAALMTAAGNLDTPLVAANYRTLIGLLAVTGMRVGEAIGLDRDDFDRGTGLLVVRNGKFGKSRELPLRRSTIKALSDYTKIRDRLCPHPKTAAFFVSSTGRRLVYNNVHSYFHRLTISVGLRPRSASCRPRPHDLRHAFAVNTLLGWYRDGGDVQARLPLLSTYLGHVHPGCTYWYLTAVPELLALAADRLHPIGPVR